MVNPPDLGMCLRFNSAAIDLFRFLLPLHVADHDGVQLGE